MNNTRTFELVGYVIDTKNNTIVKETLLTTEGDKSLVYHQQNWNNIKSKNEYVGGNLDLLETIKANMMYDRVTDEDLIEIANDNNIMNAPLHDVFKKGTYIYTDMSIDVLYKRNHKEIIELESQQSHAAIQLHDAKEKERPSAHIETLTRELESINTKLHEADNRQTHLRMFIAGYGLED